MLSWLSQAVRVGAQCKLKTIEAGVEAARRKQVEIEDAGGALVEGSVLVLVEPGVYEEERLIVVDGTSSVSASGAVTVRVVRTGRRCRRRSGKAGTMLR